MQSIFGWEIKLDLFTPTTLELDVPRTYCRSLLLFIGP